MNPGIGAEGSADGCADGCSPGRDSPWRKLPEADWICPPTTRFLYTSRAIYTGSFWAG